MDIQSPQSQPLKPPARGSTTLAFLFLKSTVANLTTANVPKIYESRWQMTIVVLHHYCALPAVLQNISVVNM